METNGFPKLGATSAKTFYHIRFHLHPLPLVHIEPFRLKDREMEGPVPRDYNDKHIVIISAQLML